MTHPANIMQIIIFVGPSTEKDDGTTENVLHEDILELTKKREENFHVGFCSDVRKFIFEIERDQLE